jgi:hypothetical protein
MTTSTSSTLAKLSKRLVMLVKSMPRISYDVVAILDDGNDDDDDGGVVVEVAVAAVVVISADGDAVVAVAAGDGALAWRRSGNRLWRNSWRRGGLRVCRIRRVEELEFSLMSLDTSSLPIPPNAPVTK